jgi:hypothetical protein
MLLLYIGTEWCVHWPTGMARRNDLGQLHWPTSMAQMGIGSSQPVWHGEMIWANCIGRPVWHGQMIWADCIGWPVWHGWVSDTANLYGTEKWFGPTALADLYDTDRYRIRPTCMARTNDLGWLHWPTGMAWMAIWFGQPVWFGPTCMARRNDLGWLHWPTGMARIGIGSGQPVWHGEMIWANCIGQPVWHG